MGVAGEIGEHRLGAGKGRLGIDEPVLPPQRREMGGEGLSALQALDLTEEYQPACRVGVGEPGQEEPPEQARQHPHRQQKAGLAAHPARAVERYPAARHNHMDVRVVGHCRAPAVEHGGGADASAEVLGIGGDRQQCLGGGAEQQVDPSPEAYVKGFGCRPDVIDGPVQRPASESLRRTNPRDSGEQLAVYGDLVGRRRWRG